MQSVDRPARQGVVLGEEVGEDFLVGESAVVKHRDRSRDELGQVVVVAEQQARDVLHALAAVHQDLAGTHEVVHTSHRDTEVLSDIGQGEKIFAGEKRVEVCGGRGGGRVSKTHAHQSTRVGVVPRLSAILEGMSQLAVGDVLEGRYVIDRPIARGGMSTVYRCVDSRLDREVAAKVMDGRYVHDRVFRERFRREALAMAKLSHPNLVNVYDFSAGGDHPDQVFLIMELITGGTLRELLAERGPMPPHAAAAVMRAMLTGLRVAHSHGMVHRDIKPDNVLIDNDHSVKLADFGLVRAAADSPHSTDQIVGTVSYLSPEQVDGSSMTQASDVYSAGIVLFELLTGSTPFSGDTPLAHAYARLHEDVPAPSSRIAGVPKLFDELVATATSRNPQDRFHDAGEFLAALDDVASALHLPDYTVPAPTNSAANRAAAHPTTVTAATAGISWAEEPQQTRAFEDRLFPGVEPEVPTPLPPVAAPVPAPVPAPVEPPRSYPVREPYPATRYEAPPQPELEETPPPIKPVTNRSGTGLAIFLVASVLVTAAALVGAWWFGSGMYGLMPQLIVPMAPPATP